MDDAHIKSKIEIELSLMSPDDTRNPCVLLTTGSFNPIHRQHLEQFNTVQRFLSQKWKVLACIVSPSHDEYIKRKLGDAAIPFSHRCKMCKLAIEECQTRGDAPFLVYGWEGGQEHFENFSKVKKHLESACLPDPSADGTTRKVTVLYVCGADHFENCCLESWRDVVAVPRPPYPTPKLEDPAGVDRRNVFVIPQQFAKGVNCSSTDVRKRLQEGKTSTDLTFPSVCEYISANKHRFV